VVVMDGFVGNVVLKFAESIMPTLKEVAIRKIKSSSLFRQLMAKISLALLKPILSSIKSDFNDEKYGGTPLLGVNGVIVKAHGKSTPEAFKNAIGVARKAVQGKMVTKIKEAVGDIPKDALKLQPDSK